MLKRVTFSFLWLFSAAVLNKVHAQTAADSINNQSNAYNKAVNQFNNNIGAQSRLFNGEEYLGEYPGISGSAYFSDSDNWATGTVVYDGYSYSGVKMKYDIYKDVVVIMLYQSGLKISLLNDKLTSFDLYGRHFVYIKNNPAIQGAVKAGIYNELYSGKIQVLSKWDKSVQQEHSMASITNYFLTATDYYIFKNDAYLPANSKSEFLNALNDKKQNLQQFIRANKIKFNKDSKETAMARVAAYYDQLNQ